MSHLSNQITKWLFVLLRQAEVEDLKMFLQVVNHDGLLTKLDNLYVVLVLHVMHPKFEHVREQILSGQEVPTMENLI